MTSFLRFLSKRAKTYETRHTKLNGCEDLKETLDALNNRTINANASIRGKNSKNQINNLIKVTERKPSHFLSFKSLQKYTQQQQQQQTKDQKNKKTIKPKDQIECACIFLDGQEQSFFIDKKSTGSRLYEQVFYHLDLIETDYFGLQYTDTHNVQHWLDPAKLIRKQCKIGPPYTFFFKVKFYTTEPNNLKEEITRYFYFLQLKSDIRTGRLPCAKQISAELAAMTLQEELGDYDAGVHNIDTVSEFRFVPDTEQTEEFEEDVLRLYQTKCAGLTPAEAELMYLNKAKWLELYGVDMHQVYGRDQNEYKLGLTPSGILVFEGEQKIGLFYWPKIEKITFTKKKFTIIVTEDDDNGYKQEHTFIFNLIDDKACKHLWKCAVEYHAFFRLRSSPKPLNHGLNGFIRHASRFRGPQRTEFQTTNSALSTRRSVQFERRPSQRFSRRASYALRRKLQEQQKIRDKQHGTAEAAATAPVVAKQFSTIEETADCMASGSSSQHQHHHTATTIREEAENAQARLKQIELESDLMRQQQQPTKSMMQSQQRPTMPSSSHQQSHGNCCKLQQANGGNEHDVKCNLLKAQQYSAAAAAAAVTAKQQSQQCVTCSDKELQYQNGCCSSGAATKQGEFVDVILDKNEQHPSDDKVKLIDKEPITSTISSTKHHVAAAVALGPNCLKESSFTTPSTIIHTATTTTNTETTIMSTPSSSAITPSSSSSQQQQQAAKTNRRSEVIITRTQSIYNDRSATAAILHINGNAASPSSSSTINACHSPNRSAALLSHSMFMSKPITTEL